MVDSWQELSTYWHQFCLGIFIITFTWYYFFVNVTNLTQCAADNVTRRSTTHRCVSKARSRSEPLSRACRVFVVQALFLVSSHISWAFAWKRTTVQRKTEQIILSMTDILLRPIILFFEFVYGKVCTAVLGLSRCTRSEPCPDPSSGLDFSYEIQP